MRPTIQQEKTVIAGRVVNKFGTAYCTPPKDRQAKTMRSQRWWSLAREKRQAAEVSR